VDTKLITDINHFNLSQKLPKAFKWFRSSPDSEKCRTCTWRRPRGCKSN